MPELQVAYTAPVEVVVDTDTGTVTRVVIVDEQVTPALERGMFADVHDRDDYAVVEDEALADRAREIAANADWPAWEHGF